MTPQTARALTCQALATAFGYRPPGEHDIRSETMCMKPETKALKNLEGEKNNSLMQFQSMSSESAERSISKARRRPAWSRWCVYPSQA